MILSRVADGLYWMGRYLERAENTTRLLLVTEDVATEVQGLDPATVDINLDRGVLTIAGERQAKLPAEDDKKAAVHIRERFSGRFRRVVTLSNDVDPNSVSADYRDGVLHISAKRRESAQPRRITVQ